jgi:hypothetical protein
MNSDSSTNFNRELDRMLDRSAKRVEELRDLNRPLRPWEIERFKDRLAKLEAQLTWDKTSAERRLVALEKELRTVYWMFGFVLVILLLMCTLLGVELWKNIGN